MASHICVILIYDFEHSWYCYNVTKGGLIKHGGIPTSVTSTDTVWKYDNSQDDQPFTTTWNETWNEETTASVSVTTSGQF